MGSLRSTSFTIAGHIECMQSIILSTLGKRPPFDDVPFLHWLPCVTQCVSNIFTGILCAFLVFGLHCFVLLLCGKFHACVNHL